MTNQMVNIAASRIRRIVAYLIDHTLAIVIGLFIAFSILKLEIEGHSHEQIIVVISICISLIFALIICKDVYRGVSVGKYMMNIAVRDNCDRERVLSIWRLIVRNIFLIIWPIELFLVIFAKDRRRLGDAAVGSVVITRETRNKYSRLVVAAFITIVALSAFIFIVVQSIKRSDAYVVALTHIKTNVDIQEEAGGIDGYGAIPYGGIETVDDEGKADLEIKVIGNDKNVWVRVILEKRSGEEWKVMSMSIK